MQRNSSLRIVLVAPLYSGNVGSVARLATNFSVRDVVLVSPQCDWNDAQAQQYACRLGQEALASFRVVSSLGEAIGDVEAAIALSRRSGDWRQPDLDLSEIPSFCSNKKVAFVFGREDNGLTRDEVLQCTHVVAIPSSEFNPSLNLSHAVAVVLSQWYASQDLIKGEKSATDDATLYETGDERARLSQFADMMSDFRQTMLDVGLNRAGNPDRLLPHLQRLFQRAKLSSKETDIVRGFLTQVRKAVGTNSNRGG